VRQLVAILVTFMPFVCSAEVPEEIKRTAGYKSAQNILMRCTSAPDALLCLSEFGSECEPIADDGRETYRCRLTVTIEATRLSDGPQPTEVIGDYLIVSKVSNTKGGWSAEIEEVTRPT
jgi:hypothetical protein